MFQNLKEYKTHLTVKNFRDVFVSYAVILNRKFTNPIGMFCNCFIRVYILAVYNGVGKNIKLIFQSGRENRKTHNLNQTDILFFDMVQLGMRMVNTERMLGCCYIVS